MFVFLQKTARLCVFKETLSAQALINAIVKAVLKSRISNLNCECEEH